MNREERAAALLEVLREKHSFLVSLPHPDGIYMVLCDNIDSEAIDYVRNDVDNADEIDSYPEEIDRNAVTCQRLSRVEADTCRWDLYLG
jgi:hypothetical protein